MSARKQKAPPAGLARRGRELWRWLVRFEPETHELALVLEACRIVDRLDRLQAILDEEGLMTENGKGDRIAHPALIESRQQTAVLSRTISALRVPLPDGDESWDGMTSSARARRAAMARHYPGARSA